MDRSELDAVGVLKHYGVLGMRWGFRKESGSAGSGKAVKVWKDRKTGVVNTSRTKGGEGHDASGDARTTAVSRQIAKSSGTQALENKELKALIERMNLEQQYAKLTYKPSNYEKGQQYVKTLLGLGKTVNEVHAFSQTTSGKALRLAMAASGKPAGKHHKP